MTKGNTPFSDLKGGKYTTANIPKGKIPNPPFKMPKIKTSAVKIAKGTANTAKGLGLGIAAVAVERGINQIVDRGFKQIKKETRGKNMTLKQFRNKRDEALRSRKK